MPFKKGQSGNPAGKPKGIKNRDTLLREERRAIFDEEASQMWRDLIKQMKPEYIADQFMGKAPDKLDITSKDEKIESGVNIEAIAQEIEDRLKEKKLNDNS